MGAASAALLSVGVGGFGAGCRRVSGVARLRSATPCTPERWQHRLAVRSVGSLLAVGAGAEHLQAHRADGETARNHLPLQLHGDCRFGKFLDTAAVLADGDDATAARRRAAADGEGAEPFDAVNRAAVGQAGECTLDGRRTVDAGGAQFVENIVGPHRPVRVREAAQYLGIGAIARPAARTHRDAPPFVPVPGPAAGIAGRGVMS